MIREETLERLDFPRIRLILAEGCRTDGGKRLANELCPLTSPELVARRFRETEEALSFDRELSFGLCAPGEELLVELERERYLAPRRLLKLSQVLEGFSQVRKRLTGSRQEGLGCLREISERVSEFGELRARILAAVDEDGVRESASPVLSRIRREMISERRSVLRTLETMVSSKPDLFQETAVHFREARLVLALKRERESELEGLMHGISGAGATVFVEPFEVVAGNNRLRKLADEEREEVERILLALSQAVRDNVSAIRTSLDAVSALDFIFSRADWARRFEASAVDHQYSTLEIRSARHPLLSLKREVVPLELVLNAQTRVLLISGPNAGGKTVVLKTLGLLALMALCGLHVPCSPDTRLPFFDKVFIDIGDEQSIDENLSSFTAHLANLRSILAEADRGSLVLLDELGSSTSPEEGGALGMAVLSALVEKGATVVATSHLESLKYFVEEKARMQNAGMEFTGHPTYRLIMGIPGASNALEIAEEVGFPPEVIDKARGFLRPELVESSTLISKLSEEHRRAETLRASLDAKLEEVERSLERTEAEKAELAERRKRFDEEMLAERTRILSEARRTIENLVRELRESNASRESILKAKEFIDTQEQAVRESLPQEIAPAAFAKVAPGIKVASLRLKRQGTVLEVNERDLEAVVEMGNLRLTLPLADIAPVEEESEESHPKRRTAFSAMAEEQPFDTRLNLRGLYAEEAGERLDVYIAEAVALGVAEVTIVHGKGTGVLKNLVWDFARSDRRIDSFRVGEPFEGGDGVTVLRLKS